MLRCAGLCRDNDSKPSISIGINYIDDWNKQRALLDTTLFSLGEDTPDQLAAAAVAKALVSESNPVMGAVEYDSLATSQQLKKPRTQPQPSRNGGNEL